VFANRRSDGWVEGEGRKKKKGREMPSPGIGTAGAIARHEVRKVALFSATIHDEKKKEGGPSFALFQWPPSSTGFWKKAGSAESTSREEEKKERNNAGPWLST